MGEIQKSRTTKNRDFLVFLSSNARDKQNTTLCTENNVQFVVFYLSFDFFVHIYFNNKSSVNDSVS